jgi:hypothetical protein
MCVCLTVLLRVRRHSACESSDQRADADADVTAAASLARVLVVTAREDLTVLSEVKQLLARARWR